MSITLDGTNGVTASSPATMKANAYLDAAGGNTATINGKLPIAIGDVPASTTLLGTLATTSGTSVTLSGLTLTSYKQLQYVANGLSTSVADSAVRLNGNTILTPSQSLAANIGYGGGIIDLLTGVFFGVSSSPTANGSQANASPSGLTTSSTSITFTVSLGTFDAGTITIYGVK